MIHIPSRPSGRSQGQAPAAVLGFALLATTVAGCSSGSKEGALPPEALPAAGGTPSVAAENPSDPNNAPSGTAPNPFSDQADAPGSPSFTRPAASAPYGYASSIGGGVRYGSVASNYNGGGVRYGSGGPSFTRPPSSAPNGYGSSFGGGVRYGSSAVGYGGRPATGSTAFGGGGGTASPTDARLVELERRTVELERRIQALLPAVQRAAQDAK